MRVFYSDKSDRVYVLQDKDETLDYKIDWSAKLGSDTIDSVAYKTSGVTLTSSSNDTTTNTIWVTGTNGYVTSTITTSSTPPRVRQRTIQFKERVS